MIRLFLVCVLVATSLAEDSQTSDLKIIKQWSKGMRAEICVHHNYSIDCGWEMRLEFSGPLTYFSMTRGKTKSRGELFRSETKPFVIVRNSESNKVQASVACHRFDAYFTSPVNVSAIYSRICTEGRWTDIVKSNGSYECTKSTTDKSVADSNSSKTDETDVQQCNASTCERGNLSMTSKFWDWGIQGKVCVSYGILVTCIFDIGLTFSGSIKDLKVDGMHVSDVLVSGQEFLYTLTPERYESIRANKTVCQSYVAYHARGRQDIGVKGSYLGECHSVSITVPESPPPSIRTWTPRTTTQRITKAPDAIFTTGFDSNNTFSVIVKASWGTGQAGWICMDPKSPLTCSNVVELSFSPPVLSLETPKMTILQGNHTDDESLFTLRSRIHGRFPHWTPHCFWFIVRHINRRILTNVTLVNASQCDDVTTEKTTPTTFTTVADTTVTPATRFFNYTESLSKSMTFYFNQRAGNISDNSLRRYYPHKPTLSDDGRDLSGGLYESADFAKFNFPIAATTTTLLWGFLQWKDAYIAAGQQDEMFQLMKHALDYLISCWDNANQKLYTQVGVRSVSQTWSELETVLLNQAKTADSQKVQFTIASRNGASDLAGEMAAAMAAGSLVFKEKNPAYASVLLETAKQVYDFADKYRGVYETTNYDDLIHFQSDGFMDELCWGAAWLLRATENETYLNLTQTAAAAANLAGKQLDVYSWNYKAIGCYLLMHNYPTIAQEDKRRYRETIKKFLNKSQSTTNCGLNYYHINGPLRYAANGAMIALMAADSEINPETYRAQAEKQIKYMLGANNNNRSYQIGFGLDFPKVPQFLRVMCPDKPTECKVDKMPYIGALVSGPDYEDNYEDREDSTSTKNVAIDFNAGFQSSLAGLIHLQQINKLPNATPTCKDSTPSRRRRQARRRTLPVSD